MCGIFGYATTKDISLPYQKYTDTLSHRGPDAYGYYNDENVGLGHRRLSIIDLEGGKQPCFNNNETIGIIFNGEIYNFPELRDKLINKGYVFSSKSDTETILHAYEEWGEDCVNYLRGMFAFAIWNKIEKTLFIARDRLGIKPLFYAEHNDLFYFSSEIKAIVADPTFPRDIDEKALVSYFTLSYIPAPMTIYEKIRKLLPGHTLTWKDGKINIKKYWDLKFIPDRNKSESTFINEFMDIFKDSVKSHLISDVPLGAFLSGGVDSSAIVALMSGITTTSVNTFCMGFGGNTGGYLDERVYADMIANKYKTNHKQLEVTPDLDGILDKIVDAFDEPFADDSSIPSYFVCKIARENVKVALSGLGGDELFAGYERYLGFKLQSLYSKIPKFIRTNIISKLVEKIPERTDGHYTINHIKRFVRGGNLPPDQCYMSYISLLNTDIRKTFFTKTDKFDEYYDECCDLIYNYFNSENVTGKDNSLDRALYCDIKSYLPEDILSLTDRLSMQHSLEVRVPFIDHKVMEYCATIPPELRMKGFKKKYLLKKAFSKILPDDVINHRKQGFVGPTSSWIKNDLKPYIIETLTESNLKKHGYIDPKTVDRLLNEHFSGKQIHDKLIWSLVIFQKWYELNIEPFKSV